jgi:hypothetical protein
MSTASSTVHATPRPNNDGFGLEPVSLSISFGGSVVLWHFIVLLYALIFTSMPLLISLLAPTGHNSTTE